MRYMHLRTKGGGAVTMAIAEPEGGSVAVGLALCSPRDNFCRRTGRKIAAVRATSPTAEMRMTVREEDADVEGLAWAFVDWFLGRGKDPSWMRDDVLRVRK